MLELKILRSEGIADTFEEIIYQVSITSESEIIQHEIAPNTPYNTIQSPLSGIMCLQI